MVSLLSMASAVHAARILWVSDNGPKVSPGNGADTYARGIFYPNPESETGTPFTDQGFITLLQGAGHTVERFNPNSGGLSVDDAVQMNTYDLIIVGAATNSGPFNINGRHYSTRGWNKLITKPLIITKSTLIRRDRAGWTTGNNEYDCGADTSTTASGKLTFTVPAHPIFQGIANTAGQMTSFCNIIVPSPPNNRGSSMQFNSLTVNGELYALPANELEPGGTLLASMQFNPMNPGVNIPLGQAPAIDSTYIATGYSIAEWSAFSSVASTQRPGELLAGYRMQFACGTRDANGTNTSAPNPLVGALDLSPQGQTLFLNAVAYAASQPTGASTEPNLWNNRNANGEWNDTSNNWRLGLWRGDAAIFDGSATADPPTDPPTDPTRTVTLTSPITATSLDFRAPTYTIKTSDASTNKLTLANNLNDTTAPANPVIKVNSDVTIAAPIAGTDGLSIEGNSLLELKAANSYTGSTFIKEGVTILMNGPTGMNGTSSFSVGDIEELATGATLRLWNGVDTTTNPAVPALLRAPNGQMGNRKRFIMTGGTLDIAGEDNSVNVPAPDGTGIITNSSPYSRTALRLGLGGGQTRKFSGVIQDGSAVTPSIVSGKVGFRMEVDLQSFDGGARFIMAGQNTYSGFTRIGGGTLTFEDGGRWGVPINTGNTTTSSPGGTLIINGGINDLRIDFNGHDQTTGGLAGNGGVLANNLDGTTVTLTVGTANLSSPGAAGTATAANAPWPSGGGNPTNSGRIVDNTTGGSGKMAITKIGTGTVRLNTSQSTYSGPTAITAGVLSFSAAAAPSPNSEIKITATGQLELLYTGTRSVAGLFLNGVAQPNGVYGAGTNPGVITGPGTIYVNAATPSDIYIYNANATVDTNAARNFKPFGDLVINAPAILNLTASGTTTINGLFLSGVRQPSGVYGAIGSGAEFETASITGGGTLTVTNAQASIPATLAITGPATSPVLTWTSVGVLQSSSDLSTWTNLPSARSPFNVTPLADSKLYYRIKQ